MKQQTELTNLNNLYMDNRLFEILETLDQLHTAASDGDLSLATTLNQQDLIGLLREVIYTAQETLEELDTESTPNTVPLMLRLMEKPVQMDKRQA